VGLIGAEANQRFPRWHEQMLPDSIKHRVVLNKGSLKKRVTVCAGSLFVLDYQFVAPLHRQFGVIVSLRDGHPPI